GLIRIDLQDKSETMRRTTSSSRPQVSERQALRKRVRHMYDWLNREQWQKCFSLIDPLLTERKKIQFEVYRDQLEAFRGLHGTINPWPVRISLHLDAGGNKHDDRPFAYVYVVWQDQSHGYHMFRERWVKHDGQWFTRVVGLVASRQ